MKTGMVCLHCDGDLPHRTEVDCIRAVDREIKAAQAQLRALARRKGYLLRRRRLVHRRRLVAPNRQRRP